MEVVAADFETHRIAPGAVAPKVVCLSLAERQEDGSTGVILLGNGDPELPGLLEDILLDPEKIVVWHNGAYDLTCAMATWPHLIPAIFEHVAAGRCTDTMLREMLINLSTHGNITDYEGPDGQKHRLAYGIPDLVMLRFGEDRSGEKGEGTWQLEFHLLDGRKACDYPADAAEYASRDARDTLDLYYEQADRSEPEALYRTTRTEYARATFAFALRLLTCWGVAIDQDKVAEIERLVQAELVPENIALLFSSGALRPGIPPRPFARGVRAHVEGCPGKKCDCPPKMTEAVAESKNLKRLKEIVVAACLKHQMPIRMTDSGRVVHKRRYVPWEKYQADHHFEFVALDGEQIDPLAPLDPVLSQFQRRQMLIKLVDNQLPLLRGHAFVHGPYNALVETGRTSSYGSNHKVPLGEKGNLFPAVQIQQIPKMLRTQSGAELDLRGCYRPRPGRTFIDVDFTSLELVCVAQTTWDLFGYSKHRELINAGVDLHAYLGSRIAALFGKDPCAVAWQAAISKEGILDQPLAAYTSFRSFKSVEGDENQPWRDFYDHYRTMAKPVGLGFPGGLGPEKLATAIAPEYDVKITVGEAAQLREIWRGTYPEMADYFRWVSEQRDPYNEVVGHDEMTGDPIEGLWYVSPLGMVRRGATYCAVANGRGMQSPGAEAALIGTFNIVRACYDWTRNSVLLGARPWAFIHDQILAETSERRETWHEQAVELSSLFCAGAKNIFPDVDIKAEPMLADVWSKRAKATFDANNRLIPWRPKA